MEQSEILTNFYKAYRDWLDVGAPHRKPFLQTVGLCSNLARFCHLQGESGCSLGNEMMNQFVNAGLNDQLPFNNTEAGDEDYANEATLCNTHLNPKRIKWVREHADL